MLGQEFDISAPAQRRLRLLASLGTAAILLVIGWQLLLVLVPLIISTIAAVMLMPVMKLGERSPLARRWPKYNRMAVATLASLLALVVVLGLIGLGTYGLIGGAQTFYEAAPAITEQTTSALEQIESAYRERVPESIQEQLDPRIEEYRDSVSDSIVSMAENIAGLVQSNVSQVITLIATPIAIFQILYQPKALTDALRRLVPGPLQEDLPEMGRIAGVTVIAYIRVQLLGAVFVGSAIWLLYWAVGIKLSLPLGMLAAITELVPILGTFIFLLVMVVAVVLTDLGRLPLAIFFFVLIQVIHNAIILPRLQVRALGLHPVIIVVSLAIFTLWFGVLGALVAAPLTGVAFRVMQYSREVWNNAAAES